MALPNFFIVGAAKSGTTSLYHCLAQHPDVFMPELKEPHYFVDWGKYVSSLGEYEALFSGVSGQKAIGEASTGYLFEQETPGRIKGLIPGARIIIILRNPADMAFALWRHMRRLGKRGEKLSFEKALAAEPGRMADPAFRACQFESWHGNFYYFGRALYHGQVNRYIDAFGPDRVLVLIFEEFREDPLGMCRQVFGFLGVDTGFRPEASAKNVGREVRHRGLKKLLDEPTPSQARLAALLPEGLRAGGRRLLVRLNSKPVHPLDPVLKKELMDRFMPDVKMLEGLLGRDLSLWY